MERGGHGGLPGPGLVTAWSFLMLPLGGVGAGRRIPGGGDSTITRVTQQPC